MNHAMPRRCSETKVGKEGIWIQSERNRRGKLEKRQLRMRNMHSGGKGKSAQQDGFSVTT